MSIKVGPLRYAHDEGHTDVCCSYDGSKYITCGADGDIRIWSVEAPDDPDNKCLGEWACSVKQCQDNLYVATSNNDIQVLTYPEGERNLVLDRFIAPINHIAVHNECEYIALAGEDMEVKLINTKDNKKEVFTGLKGPCLSVALSPDFKFLAASSGDGFLRVWEISTKQLVKEIADHFPKTNSFKNAQSLCRVDFHPGGKYLASPNKNTVVLLNTSDWSNAAVLDSSQVTVDYSIVQFSPCGYYLVATSIQGDFLIFKVASEVVVASTKHVYAKAITGLMWNPLGNGEIVYTDIEGQLGMLEECIPVKKDDHDEQIEDMEPNFGDVQFEDDDEDDENVISVEKLKKQVMGETEPELNFDEASSRSPTPRAKTPEIPLQEPFMPTSTPEHLNPRYLCWNDIAIMRSYNSTDSTSDTIEIEFVDSNFHNNMMIPNYSEYTMGTVSQAAVAVASSTQISVIPLSATTKEWILKLEDDEEIVLIGLSDSLVCFATNRYKIRCFSIWGDVAGIFFSPGPLVSMAAFKNSLAIAYHAASARKNDQCIRMKLVTFRNYAMQAEDIETALNPECSVSWLGFTDLGTPAMLDSAGTLSLFNDGLWIPFCDTTKHCKGAGDGFFVTFILESCRTLVGVKCKGTIYPAITPRPTVCELNLEPPFCKIPNDQERMELDLFAWSHFKNKDQSTFNKTALKAFALACKNNSDERALSLMEKSANQKLIDLAIKYAVKMNKKHLSEKLMELMSQIGDEDAEETPNLYAPVIEPEVETIKPKPILSKRLNAKLRKIPRSTESIIMDGLQFLDNNTSHGDSTIGDISEAATPEAKPNPFAKNAKKSHGNHSVNPLSLIDKEAGVELEDKPTKAPQPKIQQNEIKRKKPDSEVDKVERDNKQRKLDKFVFTKNN